MRADLKKEGEGFVLQLGEENNSGSLWQNEGQRERSDQVVFLLYFMWLYFFGGNWRI